jgi:hypothetical protein
VPKFYFHLREGDILIEDPEGVEVVSLDAARFEAREAVRENIAEHLKAGQQLTLRGIEISDELGRPLAKVTILDALAGVVPVDMIKARTPIDQQ